ncbi:MAG TPA: response regulator [Nitrospinae bacterium]|nr:response regulator [Nitrospinota bacterium]
MTSRIMLPYLSRPCKEGVGYSSLRSTMDLREVCSIFEEFKSDLILMDIHLLGLNGLGAFKKLQALNVTKDIPFFALTANAMNRDVEKALAMGFHFYITKPIDVLKFLETVDKVLTPRACHDIL